MTAGQRFAGWIEGLAAAWGDRLRAWLSSWIVRGANELMEGLEPEAIGLVKTSLARVTDHPATPQEVKNIASTLLAGKKPLPLLLLIPLAVLLFIPMMTSIFQPLGNIIRYAQERLFKSGRLDPLTAIRAVWRGFLTEARLQETLRDYGFDEIDQQALINVTKAFPGIGDIIRFAVREVYSPEIAEAFGQFQDFPALALPDASKIGITEEIMKNYWAAHWDLPSPLQGFEMLRRGIIDEETLKLLLRALDVMPYWREKLMAISWEVPTRVDIRRFYDLKTIDEARLRELYAAQGYHGKDLDDYILWTKIYVALPDLLARWKNGWITLDDVRKELIAAGMKEAAADELIQTKVKAVEPTTTAEGKELTKTEIYKGVKAKVITPEQGVELLMDLDYSRDQAEYLLAVNVEALKGSPESFEAFKDLTQKYRVAMGMEAKPMSEELKMAAAEVIRLARDIEALELSIEEEKKGLIAAEPLPEEATRKLKGLQVKRNRAESALAKAKSDYARLVAEWRH